MRLITILMISATVCATGAPAQTNSYASPPGVSVLEYRWEKHTSNGMKYAQPTVPAVGQVVENVPDRPVVWPRGSSYFYYLKIKNDGPKTIRSMLLEYVFNDLDNKTELARRVLNTFEKIDQHKTKTIEIRALLSGPPKVATVEGIKKDRRSPFDEHVEIRCVLYTDGTGWKAPDAEAKMCDELVRLTLHPDARRN
jgi:hypothetical protein